MRQLRRQLQEALYLPLRHQAVPRPPDHREHSVRFPQKSQSCRNKRAHRKYMPQDLRQPLLSALHPRYVQDHASPIQKLRQAVLQPS